MPKLGIQELNQKYVWVTEKDGKINKKIVAPFVIKPKEKITAEDHCEIIADIIYQNKSYETTFKASDFSTSKTFRESVAKRVNPSIWYDIPRDFHPIILKILESYKVKETKGIDYSGFVKNKGDWCYVTSKATITKNGFDESIKILENFKELDNADIVSRGEISQEDIFNIGRDLVTFNELGIVGSVLGYTCSLFLRERLWKELELKFPTLAIIGTAGSGKSATLEKVIMPILNMKHNQVLSAFAATKFTMLKLASCSNLCPVIVNEYKPNQLKQNIMIDIDNHWNNSYDRHSARRGRADQGMNSYNYRAPLLLVGEGYSADQSKRDRLIRVCPSFEGREPHTANFISLCDKTDELGRLGKALLLRSLSLSKDDLKNMYYSNYDYIKKRGIKQDRAIENIATIFTGIDFLNSVMGYKGKDISNIKEQTFKTFMEDTLDGGGTTKTAVVQMLEYIDQLAYERKIVSEKEYVYKKKSDLLCLDVPSLFRVLEEDAIRKGKPLILSQSDFTSQLKKEKFYGGYGNVKFGTAQRKSFKVKGAEAIFSNIYIETLIQHEHEEENIGAVK